MKAAPEPSSRRTVRALALSLLAALAACAGLDSERHLAPLYSELSTAGGGVETEALGGAALARRAAPHGRFTAWGLRPLFLHHPIEPGTSRTDFLVPLGGVRRSPDELTWQLVPLARYSRVVEKDGGERWSFLSLLGIYFAGFPDGRRVRAWFPFAGVVEGNLTFDRLDWILFPLYARSVRQGRTSYHFLWPIFAFGSGEGMGGWRVWPLAGHTWREGSYDRWYALWPILQWHDGNLKARDDELHRHDRHVFPLYAQRTQGTFRSWGFLWPFFGYARDSESGFWAWDGPWPLVRVSRPGTGSGPHRTRFWPLYGRYLGDGLDRRTYLWPLVTHRLESYPDGGREAWNVVPFWQSWDRSGTDGTRESWRKAWPLFQRYTLDDYRRFELVTLHPFWRLPRVDLHYGWLWELYTRESHGDRLRERSWLGLYKREKDRDEDRAHVTGLWSRRRYSRRGEPVSETSLLFGLLRWRRSPSEGLDLLRPALPGPGWPLERMPSSLDPTLDAAGPRG